MRVVRLSAASFVGIMSALVGGCRCPCPCPCAPVVSTSGPPSIAARAAAPNQSTPVSRAPLPPGCSRISDGTHVRLSPDGRLFAFARWRTITGDVVRNEEKEYFIDKSAEPLIPTLWVRDLGSNTEWKVPKWTPLGSDGVARGGYRLALGWTPGGALLLADGAIVDPTSGAPVKTSLRPPAAQLTQFPDGEAPLSWSWTADGRRLAFLGEVAGSKPGTTFRRALFCLDAGGAPREFDITLRSGGEPPDGWPAWLVGARFAWARTGDALFVRLRFLGYPEGGPEEEDLIGILDARDGSMRVLQTRTFLDGAPAERTGENVWDSVGRRCAFVVATTAVKETAMTVYTGVGPDMRVVKGATRWEGTMDVYVASADGRENRRVTNDGLEKGRPSIDPAGRRVAFFVGEGAGRSWGDSQPGVRLRVVDIETSGAWESPLASPPDAWSRPDTLCWWPDGRRLLYSFAGIEGAVFLQDVPPEPP